MGNIFPLSKICLCLASCVCKQLHDIASQTYDVTVFFFIQEVDNLTFNPGVYITVVST